MSKRKGKIVVSSKIDSDLKKWLQDICEETQKSESELIRDALLAYAKKTNPNSVRSMARRVGALEQDVRQLATQKRALEQKLELLVTLSMKAIDADIDDIDVEAG